MLEARHVAYTPDGLVFSYAPAWKKKPPAKAVCISEGAAPEDV